MSILESYHENLLKHGIKDYSFEECLYDYRLSMVLCLSRDVYAVGASIASDEHIPNHIYTNLLRFYEAILDHKVNSLLV